ncbi:MAG: hypothetical protein HY673_18050 [Chloroflexi bacterium]|nr:hypothetical protein [Chloroflexota bacterium]
MGWPRKRSAIEKCALLKPDCEGGEFSFLESAPDAVMSMILKVVGEYHHGITRCTHRDLGSFLAGKNFEVKTWESQSLPNFSMGFLCASRLRDNRPAL